GKKDNKPELSREEASVKLDAWCQKVTECTLREVKSARDCILEKRDEVLNYFIKGSTNASAESINAKMKGFRSEIHGIQDLPFFLFRCTKIFG
ncbi:MAG: transposase, partial [Oscillospiraceae bacterium]|nr:transposase [Oscillospiraceae bacterium]